MGDEPLCVTEILQALPENERQMINILNQIQQQKGYISREDLQELAAETGQPESVLQGLVSFFNSFRTRPLGRNHISVCYGTACYTRGADLLYDRLAGEMELDADGTSADGFVTIDKVQCVGACSLAPVLICNGDLEGKAKSHQMAGKLRELREEDAKRG
ncbi:NAD(P)H-dependent oxidoreductase subunit E [Anaeroselena agilis]|uniref:NAD(P)H-dependent oxidoreductase subunit E n=1 Tax=Anaeroselena agilis TaxID=3063788 RepID=A0ABU3P3P6_9FIRM|nr:NAD(P)H-dependent oxidoreductase subunit E [Selenomonadales bacterium 4137-cl]